MGDNELLTDVVIGAMYVLTTTAIAITVWSVLRAGRQRQTRQSTRIGCGVAAGVLAILVITYAAGSTEAIRSNGILYDNEYWLRLADMFICSSITLILICLGIVAIARFRR